MAPLAPPVPTPMSLKALLPVYEIYSSSLGVLRTYIFAYVISPSELAYILCNSMFSCSINLESIVRVMQAGKLYWIVRYEAERYYSFPACITRTINSKYYTANHTVTN